MSYNLAIIPGDGIGPEQIEATLIVLDAIQEKLGLKFKYSFLEAGDNCLKKYGIALPEETIKAIEKADATLKGPVGETAAEVIVKLRQLLDLYANLRPAKSYPHIPSLKPNIDLLIVRENTECLYKGFEYRINEGVAIGIRIITKKASLRIAQYAFKEASKRKLKVTAVHKSNVLKATCGLFAEACREISKKYPNIKYEEMYVDAAAMELIRSPEKFDVIVTTNMFGDILSDEAAQIVGGLGLAPSANIGFDKALFEPVHGAAFDIAGKNIANPTSMILSTKMMLEWLYEKNNDEKCLEGAKIIEKALILAFEKGYTTMDLGGKLSTKEMGLKIASIIKEIS